MKYVLKTVFLKSEQLINLINYFLKNLPLYRFKKVDKIIILKLDIFISAIQYEI
jgi:hypothetical protein